MLSSVFCVGICMVWALGFLRLNGVVGYTVLRGLVMVIVHDNYIDIDFVDDICSTLLWNKPFSDPLHSSYWLVVLETKSKRDSLVMQRLKDI